MPITEVMKLMQHLNNAERKAVKSHTMLTHAFYCVNSYNPEAGRILLQHRRDNLAGHPKYKVLAAIAYQIEDGKWKKWIDEAKKAGL